MKFQDWIEIIKDALIMIFGVILIYIFWTIAICGSYGKEDNPLILKIELGMGIVILLFGLYHLFTDIGKRTK